VSYLIDALLRSRRRINTIVNSISDGFTVFDSDWRIVYINDNGAAMVHVTPQELIGKSVWKLFPQSVGTVFWEKMQKAMHEGRPIHFEYYSETRQRWFEHSAYPSPEGLTLFTRDVTDVKKDRTDLEAAKAQIERMNEQLERSVQERTSQLHSTIKELEAFSYSVSHDLRAPLRAIDGFSKLLFEDYYSLLDAEGRRLIDVIRNSTVKMGHLIDGLLAFSRLGRQALASTEVDMTELAREAFEETEAGEPGRNVDIRIAELAPALGDRVLFRQVFINLLSNALKFTRGQDPAMIEVGCRSNGDKNIFFVKDNGVGFDMRYVDKLFGVFQRLHAVNEFEGTGLGLAIVQRIIHRHGGRVWAEGALGQGATVYFSLPKMKSSSVHSEQDGVGVAR
jgi:PAS domain S-box-containing protein